MADSSLQGVIQEKYGRAAKSVLDGKKSSCCGSGAAADLSQADPITSNLYSAEQVAGLPQDAVLASLGCGNPTALAELKPGETVLDLGSGGGIDVLLSAKRVGPAGKAYGLDMTGDMLALARRNQERAGVKNAEFLKGTIEAIPLPDASVDVIISNCVINLSGDKDQVLREAFRVLKPGGRFAVSDIVLKRDLPPAMKSSMELWTGCVSGALLDTTYAAKLAAAGFDAVEIEPTRTYDKSDVEALAQSGLPDGTDLNPVVAALDGAIMSAFIRAKKPAAAGGTRDAADHAAADAAASACCGGSAPAAVRPAPAAADAKAAGRSGCGCGPKA